MFPICGYKYNNFNILVNKVKPFQIRTVYRLHYLKDYHRFILCPLSLLTYPLRFTIALHSPASLCVPN